MKEIKLKQNPDKLNKAQNIGVEYFDEIESKIPREEIDQYNNILQEIFNDVAPPNSKFEIVGSYRRGKNQSGDIDILITNDDDNKDAYDSFLKALKENKRQINYSCRKNWKELKNRSDEKVNFTDLSVSGGIVNTYGAVEKASKTKGKNKKKGPVIPKSRARI